MRPLTVMLTAISAALAPQVPAQDLSPAAPIREAVSRIRADMRAMATAIESYYVDCNAYPAWVSADSSESIVQGNSVLAAMPTFRRGILPPGGRCVIPLTLTTPIAYITSLVPDPFNPDVPSTFAYYTDGPGWILLSPGPDGDFDVNPRTVYKSELAQPSAELLVLSYDPTNGTISDGDLWRVRQ
ncbi:MAG: hypothetical protein HUU25_02405 [Candidatus Sumerlaeia bacterium]|nr:hypothetical protein [Candidatus Sumerlaeia bacterium]